MALIRLLDEEGNRNRTVAEAEMQTGLVIQGRAMELRQTQIEVNAKIQQERIKADTTVDQRKDLALRHVSWRFTLTTMSPVVFAILVAVFMFLFWTWQQPEAAGAFEKILVMLITGGLGWVAGRGRAQGAGRLEVPVHGGDHCSYLLYPTHPIHQRPIIFLELQRNLEFRA